jgi:WD40 repeat protein
LIEAENLLAEPRHEGDLSAVALGGSLAVPTLVTAAVDGSIRVSDIRTGSVRSLDQHGQRVTAVALTSRDGRLVLASSSDDRTVRIWDLDNGSCIRSLGDESTPIATVVWDSAENGRFLATASLDGLVRLWEPWTGECIQVLRGHTLPVTGLAMRNRAGRLILATSGEDDSILVWQPPN